ncbi:MAG: hypothetical protein COV46_09110 [Deltaproteobacteria bacterium CG11_big_fil_rev_8_21_14_0_20_49_13]|nr:MAG: hypothetical protein COV46_09110 [Deltaproteobacteria bacterium CG11_big_fil_rev_8_21_14_0_20_49_13]
MNKAFFVPILALALSCGKDTSTPTTDYTTGKNINTAWSVTTPTCNGGYQAGSNIYSQMTNAYVTIVSGAITSCANVMQVTPPTFRVRQGTLPSGFSVNTSEGDVNATYQGIYSPYLVGFDFTLNGTSNFITNSLNNVSLTIPFDTSLAPGATSTNTFIRILNYDDNSLVDLHGTITSNSVVAKLYGLPTQFTVAVIYNPYMTDFGSAASSTSSSSTWEARSWCTVYNWKNSNLLASAVAMGYASTASGVYAAVRDLVSNSAVIAENYYGTAGFRAPNLVTSGSTSDPCSGELGSTARYNIVINSPGPSFAYSTYGQVIRSENNLYGRIFIDPNRVDDLAASPLGSVLAAVAQEMFYPITDAYEVHSSATTKGIREGMATTYGMTIDNSNTIAVRSASDAETKLMSDFVNVNGRQNSDAVSHANQDFFAYLGRQ